jgi:heme exporter protein C
MRWELALGALGLLVLAFAHYTGLFVAPREAMMGDVYRILYAHVPTAWVALLTYAAAFVAAVGVLWSGRRKWDALVEATVEVGLVLNCLVLVQGSLWARPTWGVWWEWEPRLTTTLVMAVAFAAVLALRHAIGEPRRRAVASAVATVLAFVDVPVVYFSVRWWNTLHQVQSSPETVDAAMVLPLRIAAFGMLFLAIAFTAARWRIGDARLAREDDAPELPPAPEPLRLDGRTPRSEP